MKTIKVVGAVIRNDNNEILCALRSSTMSMPNLWEFPGGKIEAGESPEGTLIREIREELGCNIEVFHKLEEVEHYYPNVMVNLLTYEARIVSGTPAAAEHEKIQWVSIDRLEELEWAPADIPTVKKILDGCK